MAAPWSYAAVANVVIGALLIVLGVLLRRASPDRAARGPLALYLALVGANYVLDGAGSVLGGLFYVNARILHAASLLPVFLDPAAFALFALAAADRKPSRWLAAGVAAPGVAFLLLFLATPTYYMTGWPYKTWYLAYLGLYYVAGYALLTDRYLREPRPVLRDRLGVLVVAFGVVVLPRIPLLLSDYGYANPGSFDTQPFRVFYLFVPLVVLASLFSAAALLRVVPANRLHARRSVTALLALLGAVAATWTLALVPTIREPAAALLYSVRWVLFAAVLTIAVRRYDLLGLPPETHVRVRRTFNAALGIIALAEVAALLAPLPGATVQITVLAAAALVGLIAIAYAALRSAIPDSSPEAAWRRVDVYRAHVELGTSPAELEEVRARLALPEHEARAAQAAKGALVLESPPGAALAEGTVFAGRYDVQAFLGAGTFGRVFRGWDRRLGERVVLKELLPAWKGDGEAVERFRQEASIALRIDHPSLVRFRALEPAPGGHVLILAHVEGETLRTHLAKGALPPAAVASIARDLLDGLGALHAAGILHRDVKPENVIVRPDGRAVLLDFGSAAAAGGTRLAGGRAHPGTPAYMSPEQAAAQPLAPASDLYAVGVLLWEALAGAPPFLGAPPPAWEAPLRKAMERDPARRWQDAASFRAALPL